MTEISTEVKIESVQLFSATEAELQKLKEDYQGLTITGIDDHDGYTAVSDAIKRLVKIRTTTDKRRKEINKEVNSQAEKITAVTGPLETALKLQKERIDNEREKIAAEKKAAAELKFVKRTEELFSIGFTYDGVLYKFEGLVYSPGDINEATDDAFDLIIVAGKKAKADKEQAEKERAAIAEQLKADQDALEAQRKELALKEQLINRKGELLVLKERGEIESFTIEIVNGEISEFIKYTPNNNEIHVSGHGTIDSVEPVVINENTNQNEKDNNIANTATVNTNAETNAPKASINEENEFIEQLYSRGLAEINGEQPQPYKLGDLDKFVTGQVLEHGKFIGFNDAREQIIMLIAKENGFKTKRELRDLIINLKMSK